MKFENKQNGYIEDANYPWLWCLLFGWMYFGYKGAWGIALLWFVTVLGSFGIGMLIWPFFAKSIIRKNYLKKGWQEVWL